MMTNWFKKVVQAAVLVFRRPSVRRVLDTWERVFTQSRTELIVELAAQAKPIIDRLRSDEGMSGKEKFDFVVTTLTDIFKDNVLVLKANLKEATVKDIVKLAVQQQFIADTLDK